MDDKNGRESMEKSVEINCQFGNGMAVEVGVLTVGNPGSGKSFSGNALLGGEYFEHRFSATPVTMVAQRVIPAENWVLGGCRRRACIWDLEGTMESGGENIDRNCTDLGRTFQSTPFQVILFVARHTGGRLRYDDVVLFSELVRVYQPTGRSILLALNGTPPERAGDGEVWASEMCDLLRRVTNFNLELCGRLRLVPRRLNGTVDWNGPDAQFNAAVLRDLLRQSEPRSHSTGGRRIEIVAARMTELRASVDAIRLLIRQESEQHAQHMADSHIRLTAIAQQMAERDRQHNLAMLESELARQQIALVRSERDAAHSAMMGEMNRALAAEQASVQQHIQQMADLEARSAAIEAIRAQNQTAHNVSLVSIAKYLNHVQDLVQKSEENVQQAKAAAEKQKKDSRNPIKILDNMMCSFADNPLRIVPIVIAATIPITAPAIAPLIGLTTTATTIGIGATAGALSSIVNHQDVGLGAITGGLTAGVGSATTSLATIPRTAINAGVSAASAGISGQNPLSAACGSVVGACVANSTPLRAIANSSVGANIAVNVGSNTVGATAGALADHQQRRNGNQGLVTAAVSSVVTSTIAATAHATAAAIPTPSEQLPQSKSPQSELPQSELPQTKTEPARTPTSTRTNPETRPEGSRTNANSSGGGRQGAHAETNDPNLSDVGGADRVDSSVSNDGPSNDFNIGNGDRGGGGSQSTVVVGPGSVSMTVGESVVSTDGTIGFTRNLSDGTSSRSAIGVSRIYDDGLVVLHSITSELSPPQNNNQNQNNPNYGVRGDLPTNVRIVHEDIGVCYANRVVQHNTVYTDGSVTHTTTNENHFNVEGCLGQPGRALVTGTGLLIAPEIVVPLMTLATPALAH